MGGRHPTKKPTQVTPTSSPVPSKYPTKNTSYLPSNTLSKNHSCSVSLYQPLSYPSIQVYYNNFILAQNQLVTQVSHEVKNFSYAVPSGGHSEKPGYVPTIVPSYSSTRAPTVLSSTFPSKKSSSVPSLKPSTRPTTDSNQDPSTHPLQQHKHKYKRSLPNFPV